MTENNESIKQYGIVELMGNKVVAGEISKSEMLGKPMLRIDIPATSAYPAFTQFYGESAIYCITFVSEEVVKRVAEDSKVNPVSVYCPSLVTVEQLDELKERMSKKEKLLAERYANNDDYDDSDDDEYDPGF